MPPKLLRGHVFGEIVPCVLAHFLGRARLLLKLLNLPLVVIPFRPHGLSNAQQVVVFLLRHLRKQAHHRLRQQHEHQGYHGHQGGSFPVSEAQCLALDGHGAEDAVHHRLQLCRAGSQRRVDGGGGAKWPFRAVSRLVYVATSTPKLCLGLIKSLDDDVTTIELVPSRAWGYSLPRTPTWKPL